MSWIEPDSTWQKAQRRRIRRAQQIAIGLIVAYLLLAGVGTAALIVIEDRSPVATPDDDAFMTWLLGSLWGFSALIIVVSGITLARAHRRERRVLRTVPALDGQVCLRCRLPLAGDDADRRCPKCGYRTTPEKIRAYWEQYPHQGHIASFNRAAIRDLARQPGRAGRWARFLAWAHDHPAQYWGAFALLMIIYVAVTSRMMQSAFVPSLISSFLSFLPIVGIVLCLPTGTRRVGASLHCTNCEYPRAEGDSGPACPECGTPWRGPGAIVRGRLVRASYRQWIGAAILLICAGSWVSGMTTGRSWLTAATPMAVLVRQTEAAGFSAGDAWTEIQRRQLSATHERRLLEGLLETRRRGDHLRWQSKGWLTARLASGTLPTDLVDRLHGEMVEARIIPPVDVRGGVPVEIVVEFSFIVNDFMLVGCPFILVEGLTAGASRPVIGRRREAVRALRSSKLVDADGRYRLTHTIVPPASGSVTARVAFWQMTGPFGLSSHQFEWTADGAPVMPATVTWSRRVELELAIDIAPGDS
jgi:hypothetical protein